MIPRSKLQKLWWNSVFIPIMSVRVCLAGENSSPEPFSRGEMTWNGVFGLFPCRVLAEATILCIMVSFKVLTSILLRMQGCDGAAWLACHQYK